MIHINKNKKRLAVIHREINRAVYTQQCKIEIGQTTGTHLEPKCDSSAHHGPCLAGVCVCACMCVCGSGFVLNISSFTKH